MDIFFGFRCIYQQNCPVEIGCSPPHCSQFNSEPIIVYCRPTMRYGNDAIGL